MSAVVAAAAAACMAWWAAPRPVRLSGHPPSPGLARALRGRRVLSGAAATVVAAALLLPGSVAVLGAIAVGAVFAGSGLWRRRTARLADARAAAEVCETCELLSAELAAGLPPGVALARAAEWSPSLRPAAEALALGGDVPAALRTVAAQRGRGDLRLLAAGWEVAHRTGGGLADTVARVASRLRAEQQTARLVAGELASARATARLVAALPVAALTLGSGAGGSPWAFLLTTTPGLLCLAGGLTLGLAGLWWIEALTGEPP